MNEEELYGLRQDYREELMEDRRLANRSAEEILEEIEDWFYDNYANLLEQAYNKLRDELRDYGMDTSTDDVFTNCLDACTNWRNPLSNDVAVLRMVIKDNQWK